MLQDRLIGGINDVAILKRLLSKGDDLTLKDALQHATSLNLAMKDSKELHPSGSDPVHSTRAGGRHQKPHYSNSITLQVVVLNVAVTDVVSQDTPKINVITRMQLVLTITRLVISAQFAAATHDDLLLHVRVVLKWLIVLYTIYTQLILRMNTHSL